MLSKFKICCRDLGGGLKVTQVFTHACTVSPLSYVDVLMSLFIRYINAHAKKHSEANEGHFVCMDASLMAFW